MDTRVIYLIKQNVSWKSWLSYCPVRNRRWCYIIPKLEAVNQADDRLLVDIYGLSRRFVRMNQCRWLEKRSVHHWLPPSNEIGWSMYMNKPTDANPNFRLTIHRKWTGTILSLFTVNRKNVKFYINGKLNQEGKYTVPGSSVLSSERIGSWDGSSRDYGLNDLCECSNLVDLLIF